MGSQRLSVTVWLWGVLAIALISLSSLLSIAAFPLLGLSCPGHLRTFLVALAVGTLSADALLHLMPHAHEDQGQVAEQADRDSVWKGLAALGGIYMFFLIENFLEMCRGGRKGKTGKRKQRKQSNLWIDDKGSTDLSSSRPAQDSHGSVVDEEEETPCWGRDVAASPDLSSDRSRHLSHGAQNSEERELTCGGLGSGAVGLGGVAHGPEDAARSGMEKIACMVNVGDSVHNFTDGLAIGAAFATGISGGLSTSIAVFCHELPHELGDFAVLMQAGVSVRQAIACNLLSAALSLMGMVIGLTVAQYLNDVTPWVFTTTAGIFLYVALVDMLPELVRVRSSTGQWCCFLIENMGFLLGVGVMLCIALFEHQLVIDISS